MTPTPGRGNKETGEANGWATALKPESGLTGCARFDSRTAPETHALIGAAIEVQRVFGTGLLESAYGDAFEIELQDRGIPYEREASVTLTYKDRRIRSVYRADFVCFGNLIVELKASSGLGNAEQAQMWHYLAATGMNVGLLLNFGHFPIQVRRFAKGGTELVSLDSADSAASPVVS